MKSSISIALASVGITQAALGPGFEDNLHCPEGNCEIYINPFGYVGPVSMSNKCFDTTTGTFSNGVWTGELTNVEVPEGWKIPEKCTEAQYTQCFSSSECSLDVGPGCSCYVSSTIFPFDASGFRDASCTGNECDGYVAGCSPGVNGEGGTCTITIDSPEPPTTTTTTTTTATESPPSSTTTTTTSTTSAADTEETTTTTSTTVVASPSKSTEASSGNVASVSIPLFVLSAVFFGLCS